MKIIDREVSKDDESARILTGARIEKAVRLRYFGAGLLILGISRAGEPFCVSSATQLSPLSVQIERDPEELEKLRDLVGELPDLDGEIRRRAQMLYEACIWAEHDPAGTKERDAAIRACLGLGAKPGATL